eukprot:4555873-Prymnesium_polylepis.1
MRRAEDNAHAQALPTTLQCVRARVREHLHGQAEHSRSAVALARCPPPGASARGHPRCVRHHGWTVLGHCGWQALSATARQDQPALAGDDVIGAHWGSHWGSCAVHPVGPVSGGCAHAHAHVHAHVHVDLDTSALCNLPSPGPTKPVRGHGGGRSAS